MDKINTVAIPLMVAFMLCLANITMAQFEPAPVVKSTQKVMFKGKVYYIHTVKQNQTLHSISRAYNVTIQDIAAANPNIVLEVIKPGQALKIPVISTLDNLSESYFNLSKRDFIYHKIKPHQTIYYISKKYNISPDLIYKYNPGSSELIQVGQELRIPKPHVVKRDSLAYDIADSSMYYHVKNKDTLYSIAKKYGVTVADFIELNPSLRWGLKAGMYLRIPGKMSLDIFTGEIVDTLLPPEDKIELYTKDQCDSIKKSRNNKTVKIALLLPFYAEENLYFENILNDSIKKTHPYRKLRGTTFVRFYQGLLLALDSLKESDYNITLFTYDTHSDTNIVKQIIKEFDIVKPNIIIGPVNEDNINKVSEYSEANKTALILPFKSANGNINNPYSVYILPDLETEINSLADYVSKYHDKNIILIHDMDSSNVKNITKFREVLFSNFKYKSTYEEALYKEIRVTDTMKYNIAHTFRHDIENIVIVISNKEAYVSNIIGLLNVQHQDYQIKVIGLPSWHTFHNLSTEKLHELNTVLYTPFYIDYNNPRTQSFVRRCRKTLGYEPHVPIRSNKNISYVYLGYETTLMFVKAHSDYGDGLSNCMCNVKEKLPQSNYSFKKIPGNGFTNTSLSFIEYSNDYKIRLIEYKTEHLNLNKPVEPNNNLLYRH